MAMATSVIARWLTQYIVFTIAGQCTYSILVSASYILSNCVTKCHQCFEFFVIKMTESS